MAVRPPGNDSSEPETIEFGIAALDARLDEADVSFPATGDEVLAALGDTQLPYDASGRTMALAEAFDRLPDREFENRTELMNALYPVFEEAREGSSTGFLGRLREALPF